MITFGELFRSPKGAVFSDDECYRYHLWRTWDNRPHLTFIGLNPSTADALRNDPTVERMVRRAQKMGYGGLRVVNLFAFRATDPKRLLGCKHPVGDDDSAIISACGDSGIIIAGWGCHGSHMGRGNAVFVRLVRHGLIDKVHVLGYTKSREPRHPLYISYDKKPMPWEWDYAG